MSIIVDYTHIRTYHIKILLKYSIPKNFLLKKMYELWLAFNLFAA